MNALSQEARALIDSVATRDDPSGSDKTRVRARLAAELGAAAFATLAASAGGATAAIASESASSTSTVAKNGSLLGKLSVAGTLAAAVAVVLWLSADRSAPHEQQRTRAVVTSSVAPSHVPAARNEEPAAKEQSTPVVETAPAPAKLEAKRTRASEPRSEAHEPAPNQPSTSAANRVSTLGLELKLLSAAQAALRAGTPERALVLVAEHRASFPDGVMKEERLGIEAIAGCALGRDYRIQAEAFLRSANSSPLRARVQKACGIEP